MAQPTHRYILQWSRTIAPQVNHFRFVREDGEPLLFTPGQFITLHVEGPNKILHRSYSIANAPLQDNGLEIACTYVPGGVASQLLFALKPGDIIQASGPYGLFVLKDEAPARYILVATGTGVTPYRSMLNELKRRLLTNSALNVIVVLGTRNRMESLFAEDFIACAEQHPNFTFKACYSREKDDDLKPFESLGHVQTVFPDLKLDPLQDLLYLCGNPNMIDDAYNLLTAQGFDRTRVRREKYLFAH